MVPKPGQIHLIRSTQRRNMWRLTLVLLQALMFR